MDSQVQDFRRCPRVWVYGTLRRKGSNHWRMAGSSYLGTLKIPGRLFKIDWYPGLVIGSSDKEVLGELFELNDVEQLTALDSYEGREYRRVLLIREGWEFWVWEYTENLDGRKPLNSGDWLVEEEA